MNGEGDFTDESALAVAACHALDKAQPDWRELVRSGEPVFELQVPEVWTALHHLREMPWRIKPGKRPPRLVRARLNRRTLMAETN